MKKHVSIGIILLFVIGVFGKSTVVASDVEAECIKMSDGSLNLIEEERGNITVCDTEGEEIVTAKKSEDLVALDVYGNAYQVANKKERFFYKILNDKGELQETPDGRVAAWIVTSNAETSNIKANDALSYDKKTDTLTIKNIQIEEMDIYVTNLYVASTSRIDNIVVCNDVTLDIALGNRLNYKTSNDMMLSGNVDSISNSNGSYYRRRCNLNKDVRGSVEFANSVTSYTYTGGSITPNVTVKADGKVLVKGKDYTVSYTNNINCGTANVIVNGIGDYSGQLTKQFSITKYNIAGCTVNSLYSMTYTGQKLTQPVTVKHGSKTLISGTDYTVDWKNNTNAGTATVTINGTGKNYVGSKSVSCVIARANINNASISFESAVYNGKAQLPKVKTATYNSRSIIENTHFKVKYSNNVNAGTGTATVTGIGNFTGTKNVSFTIQGKEQKIVCTSDSVSIAYEKSATRDLGAVNKEGGGKLSYKSSNTSVVTVNSSGIITVKGYGNATITVTAAAKGNYRKTTKNVSVKVAPKKTKIKSLTSTSAGTFKVQWEKVSGASGYIVKYATKSDLSNAKKVTIADNAATSKTIKNLSKGQRYYVTVYVYRNIGNSSTVTSSKATINNVVTKK